MSDYLVRSAGWNAVVSAESPGEAVDKAIHAPDAPDLSKAALGLVIQVVDLDAVDAIYVETANILAGLGYRDVETVGGLVISADALKEKV